MTDQGSELVVYWRPGCPFCSQLLGQLDRYAVPHQRIDIWADPEAAAVVRSVANGNETVPTVVVGPVALVNPSLDAVLTAAVEHAPAAVPDGWEPAQPGRLGRLALRLLGGRN